jgi:hypothetical protein
MDYFYSPSTGWFYREDIHGPRRLVVPDPAWVRPLIVVTLPPGSSYPGEPPVFNETEEPMTLEDVPDLDAVPAVIEVDNPDCKIPADAVKVTEAERVQLSEGEASGKRIVPGADGRPVLAEPEPLNAAQVRAAAVETINTSRDADLVAGVMVDGKRYHTDDRFLTELLGMLLGYQAGVYSGLQSIRTMDNQIEQLDQAQITALAAAVGAHRKAVYAASWAAKDAL